MPCNHPEFRNAPSCLQHLTEYTIPGSTVLAWRRLAAGKQRLHGTKQLWHIMRLRPEIHVGESVNNKQLYLALRQGIRQRNALGIGDQVVTTSMQQEMFLQMVMLSDSRPMCSA